MTDPKVAWGEVADSITELGHTLRTHFDDVIGEHPSDRKGLDDALTQLRTTLDRAYTAAGHALKDPALRGNATKVGASFVDAVSTTLTDLGNRLKEREK